LNEYASGYFARQKAIGFQTRRECLRVSAGKLLDDDRKKNTEKAFSHCSDSSGC